MVLFLHSVVVVNDSFQFHKETLCLNYLYSLLAYWRLG
jgi:hypothetical protein